jgi:hypothetical protein
MVLILLTMIFAVLWRAGYIQFMESADLDATFTPTIDTGIFGRVTLLEGSCMGGFESLKRCRVSHPSRRVTVREVATSRDMDRFEPTLLVNAPPLVASAVADERGFFQVALPSGTYSVFVDDMGREYCNNVSEQGACTVTVVRSLVLFDRLIDHAVF